MSETEQAVIPKIIISYSHDSDEHKTWVRNFATILRTKGIDVILDQWDLDLGSNLPQFMEQHLSGSNRVLAVCSDNYVKKANKGIGGVGYEKMILSAELVNNSNNDKVIPIIKNNTLNKKVPTFLSGKFYQDYDDENNFDMQVTDLLRELHGVKVFDKPPIGINPFNDNKPLPRNKRAFPISHINSSASGTVKFDYSNNSGGFRFGSGEWSFDTQWSSKGDNSVYAYDDASNIASIGIVYENIRIEQIVSRNDYDFSSRSRGPKEGQIVVWQNTSGYYMATKILEVSDRERGKDNHFLEIEFKILKDRTSDFSVQ